MRALGCMPVPAVPEVRRAASRSGPMDPWYFFVGALVVVALVVGYGLARLHDRLRLISTQTKVADITA